MAPQYFLDRDKSDSALAVTSKAVAALRSMSFRFLLLGPIGPTTQVLGPTLGAAVSAIIEQLAKQNSEIEAKLDRIMAEPLTFARRTLLINLSITPTTKLEIAERERPLTTAHDKLTQAYIYANEKQATPRILIEIYQAFIAALMRDGGAYAELSVQKFKNLSDRAQSEAETALIEAEKIDPDCFENNRSELVAAAVDYMDQGYRNMAVDKNIEDARGRKLELNKKAVALREAARRLDVLEQLIRLQAKQTAESCATSK